jgi:hypothetical protein
MAISSRHGAIHQSPSASAIALTFADWQELFERAQQQGEVVDRQTALGTQMNLPSVLGEGCDRIIQLRGGLTIHIRNAKLRQTIAIEQQHEDTLLQVWLGRRAMPVKATFAICLSNSSA